MLKLSGFVYPAMQGLVEKGLVKAVEEDGKTYYIITKSGLNLLNANMARIICLGLPVSFLSSLAGFWLSIKLAPRISIVEKDFP